MKLKKCFRRAGRWSRSRFAKGGGVLLYHRVAVPEEDRFRLCVSPKHFREQMAVLAESGGAVPVAEMVDRQRKGTLEAGSVAVTFDDGYVDNLLTALPILERFGIPATVFVVTGNLGEQFWWDRLEDILGNGGELPERLRIEVDGDLLEWDLAGKGRDEISPMFRGVGPALRGDAVTALAEAMGYEEDSEGDNRRSMTADELRELAGHPLITIGAHTESHGRLSGMGEEEQRGEIRGSKERLEALLNKEVTAFSYPFGLRGRDFTEVTMGVAGQIGFDCAFAADFDVVRGRSDPFAIPRLWVHDWDGARFRKRIGRWVSLPKASPDRMGMRVASESRG